MVALIQSRSLELSYQNV